LHLLAFVESLDHVCCRYRLRAFEPALREAGHTIEYRPHPRGWWETIGELLPAADACIIQRRLPTAWELNLLRRRFPQLIFDFDDAVWLRDSFSPRGLRSARRLRRFRGVVRTVDSVIAGNWFLAEQAARFTDPNRVHVIPTCVDPTTYPSAPHSKSDSIKLVWIGSSSTLRGLERIAPTLEAIAAAIPGVRLKLVCDRSLELRRMPVEWRRWDEATEAAELAAAGIGIAWVPDDDWSRGKCGLKVLQYMAAGLPVIANPVGVHGELVRPNSTGFLADSVAEWVDAVRALASDRDLRGRIGQAGRALVESEYSVVEGAGAWTNVLDSFIPARQAA
jgi:glycosyltransferase involved in cell wall biosynthesis